MSGIYYLLSMIAIFVVIRWFIANDKIAANGTTTGLLAMRDSKPDKKQSPDDKHRNRYTRARPANARQSGLNEP
jgi:hypothetical protein